MKLYLVLVSITLASRGQCAKSDDCLMNAKDQQYITDEYDDICVIEEKKYPKANLDIPGEHWTDRWWRISVVKIGEAFGELSKLFDIATAWCKTKWSEYSTSLKLHKFSHIFASPYNPRK